MSALSTIIGADIVVLSFPKKLKEEPVIVIEKHCGVVADSQVKTLEALLAEL